MLVAPPVFAQGTDGPADCVRVSVQNSADVHYQTGEIDWLALSDLDDPSAAVGLTSEGCLLDNEGVAVEEIVVSDSYGSAIINFVDSNAKVHKAGGAASSRQGSDSERLYGEDESVQRNWFKALMSLPAPLLFFFALAPAAILAYAMYWISNTAQNTVMTTARRYTCRIEALVEADGTVFGGRIARLGPTSCQFVPHSPKAGAAIGGMLMHSDLPLFELVINGERYEVMPDTPASRFTTIYFYKPISEGDLRSLLELSATPVRKEDKRPKAMSDAQRALMRQSREARATARLNPAALA